MAVPVKVTRKATRKPVEAAARRGKQLAAQALSVRRKPREFQEQFADLRKKLGITQKGFAQLTSSSLRAVARWEAGEKPGEMAKRTLNELRRLYNISGVMRKDYIAEWLSIPPNPVFDGFKPLEIIERGESDRIWKMIYDLEAGEPS
jgi:DNA-binding transcriptional regulator YiaG